MFLDMDRTVPMRRTSLGATGVEASALEDNGDTAAVAGILLLLGIGMDNRPGKSTIKQRRGTRAVDFFMVAYNKQQIY